MAALGGRKSDHLDFQSWFEDHQWPLDAGVELLLFHPRSMEHDWDKFRPTPIRSSSKLVHTMKAAILLVSVSLLSGCIREEDAAQEQTRLQREAGVAFQTMYTNSVVGYRRTVETSTSFHGPYLEWKAKAVVEFVNRNGGVERTNLDFDFKIDARKSDGLNHAVCSFDWKTAMARAQGVTVAEIERRLRDYNRK